MLSSRGFWALRNHGGPVALAAITALFLIALPVIAEDVAVPLPDLAFPPLAGKTGSFDIIDIDQAAHLMYIADRPNPGVDVWDISTPAARYLMTIRTGPANGVTVAKNVNKVFVGLTDSSVAVVDIAPGSPTYNTVIAKLPTGGKKRTDETDYDPRTMKLYAANSDDGLVTVVDAVHNRIVKQFTNLGEGLEQPRYNPADGMMYMTSSDQNTLFQFNPRTDTLVQKWNVGVACDPNGLAINPSTNQALLGCSNKKTPMVVLWDLKAAKVVSTFTQAGGCDQALYDAKTNLFIVACANNPKGAVVSVFTGSQVRWLGNVPTAVGSHAVGFDNTNHVIYTIDQRPNHAGLMSFWMPTIPK